MLEPIHRRTFSEPDRAAVQERIARAVESDPEPFLERYRALEQSLGARYVSADLFKETFDAYGASAAARHRYNACVHNAAAVLASEQLRRLINHPGESGCDTVILLTGIPGAGKTSSVLESSALPEHIRAVYEGQLANRQTALAKIQQVLDGGRKPVIVVVHATPERALENTLQRFEALGRGAGIGVMASIQGNLPAGLQAVQERFGERVGLQIVDRRVFQEPKVLDGWEHLAVLRSEGDQEHIRQRLAAALEQRRARELVSDEAYRQALSLAPGSQNPQLDLGAGGRDEALEQQRGRAAENSQEALLSPSPALTAAERLRLRSDEVAARLAAEREQVRPAREGPEQDLEQQLEQEKQQEHDKDHGLEP